VVAADLMPLPAVFAADWMPLPAVFTNDSTEGVVAIFYP